MTTKRNGKSVPTGFCITGHHKACTEFYLKQAYSRGCTCKCHPKVDKEVNPEVDSKDD